MSEKFSQYEVILYPENMIPEWIEEFSEYIPYRACAGIHDKDTENGIPKKEHIHLILCTESKRNRTTAKHFIDVANRLSLPGCKCCSTGKPVFNLVSAYDYLLHDTEKARKQGKYLYPESNRICFNGFEISDYIQISDALQDEILQSLIHYILSSSVSNMADLCFRLTAFSDSYGFEFSHVFHVFKKYNSIIARVTQGVYHKVSEERERLKESCNAS